MKVGPILVSNTYICGDYIYYGNNFKRPYLYSFSVTDIFIQSIKRKQ